MAIREGHEAQLARWKTLEVLQRHYADFDDFLADAMEHLGFDTSPVQYDIGRFLSEGPRYAMVQAQRGQAKTTITAAYAVWSLIHDPKHRVLVLSAGGTQANEISTLIVRLIMTMEGLDCLRPDPTNGDRTSVEAFDVHYTLKGVDKSPSVACVGVTGNIQGKRADLLIADDIESMKNSRTAGMRELLLEITRDFTSICSTGKIIYLGTPQSIESVYNTLPGRGFVVRIWPGRYPTPAQRENYGDMLAPLIARALDLNPALAFGGGMLLDQGQPTDPTYLTEEILQKKELDQGPSFFQLQHMLNTKLADAERFPLKPEHLIVLNLGRLGEAPMTVKRGLTSEYLQPYSSHNVSFKMSAPHAGSVGDLAKFQGVVMYVDPAGGGKNGDETGYAVTGFLNGIVYVLAAGGVPGGYSIEQMKTLRNLAKLWKVNRVIIEKNMGYGAFREVFLPVLRDPSVDPATSERLGYDCAVDDDMVHGQKELRIIETLEPVMARGALVFNESIVQEDMDRCAVHSADKRKLYSLFHQMSKITRDRNCLSHDDRLDALEGAVRYWQAMLAIDQQKAVEAQRAKEMEAFFKDPFGHNKHQPRVVRGASMFNKYRR
ncbi:large terminase [Caulobacter phage Percy]|uniref:Large terminase n=1 Tax=Caulobacter phage Percy TaxID=1701809 RepID=A0A0M4R1W9_9CAUD|nr:terminase large subunit [Caulobacter phage Percy]ALF01684.1 large terminase [Caulobacter phage Percy]